VLPGGHHAERDDSDQQRQPYPWTSSSCSLPEHQINQQQSAAADHDQPQRRRPPRTGEKNSSVVMVIVPVTAMPNAYASAAELRNANTR
jgi:hypothetical protein